MLDNIKIILVFVLVFAFASNGYEIMDSFYQSPIREAYWYLLLLGITAVVLLLTPMDSLSNIPKPVFIWVLVYLTTIVVSYALSTRSELVLRLATLELKALSVFVSMFILITNEKILKAGLWASFLVLVVAVGANVYEFFDDSIEWSYIPGRSSGWYYDANLSARNIVMSLLFASLVISRQFLWPVILFATLGVFLTFSRGGWLMLFLVILGVSLLQAAKPGKKINILDIRPSSFMAMVFGGMVATALLVLLVSGEAYQLVKDTPLEEYLREDTIGRLSGEFKDDSTDYRKTVLLGALKLGAEHPFLGAGLGSTHEWQYTVAPHNDYATLFAERGIFGLASYLFLLSVLWYSGSGYAKLFTLILAFSSITSHTTFHEPATFIFAAFALLYKEAAPPPDDWG